MFLALAGLTLFQQIVVDSDRVLGRESYGLQMIAHLDSLSDQIPSCARIDYRLIYFAVTDLLC
jgi:hypothetical protein